MLSQNPIVLLDADKNTTKDVENGGVGAHSEPSYEVLSINNTIADEIDQINERDVSNIDTAEEEKDAVDEEDCGEEVSKAWPDLDAALLPLKQHLVQNDNTVGNQEPAGTRACTV